MESIPENTAPPAIATIYADIRTTLRVPATNLVWRHIASFDGALAEVWRSVKPLYGDERVAGEAARLRELAEAHPLISWHVRELDAMGMKAGDIQTVRAVLQNYDQSNPVNLIALMALLASVTGSADTPPVPLRKSGPQDAAIVATLPPLIEVAAMSPETRRLAQRLNDIGLPLGERELIAGVPRHLAHWPLLLEKAVDFLAPHATEISGRIDAIQASAWTAGCALARELGPVGPGARSAAVATALRQFTSDQFIANYIVKVRLLLKALPDSNDSSG